MSSTLKIVVFWHNYLVHDWKDLISDQFKNLYESGLYDVASEVCCGAVGTNEDIKEHSLFVRKLVASFTKTDKVKIRSSTENHFEYLTVAWLQEYCKDNDIYVFYFHTKGISIAPGSFERKCRESCRLHMEYFCIKNWKDCVAKLDEGYDCCGSLCYFGRYSHFLATSGGQRVVT